MKQRKPLQEYESLSGRLAKRPNRQSGVDRDPGLTTALSWGYHFTLLGVSLDIELEINYQRVLIKYHKSSSDHT